MKHFKIVKSLILFSFFLASEAGFSKPDLSQARDLKTRKDVLLAYKKGLIDFSGLNLSGIDLSKTNLKGVNFTGASLYRTNLKGANLQLTNFTGANLFQANLTKANLYEANLHGANLLMAILLEANLKQANLFLANLAGANLSKTNFKEAKLKVTNLSYANLFQANFTQANLEDTNFLEANFKKANLKGANLKEANLKRAFLKWAKYNKQTKFPDNFDPKKQGMIFIKSDLKKSDQTKSKKPAKRSLSQITTFFIPKSMFLDEFPYPFKTQSIDIPDFVLNTIQNSDILFLGEFHAGSSILREKQLNEKSKNKPYRLNSLNQENIYFHLIDSFSKIHKTKKKCLWLEYHFNPSDEGGLNGLSYKKSHYYLINTAKEQGWAVFPVDDASLPPFSPLRDYFMAEQIAKTISDGLCEKGMAQNGIAHLTGFLNYIHKHELESLFNDFKRDEYLNEILKIKLDNLNLPKRIGLFIIEDWTDIIKTREDFLSAYGAGQRDFRSWNFKKADLSEINFMGADLRGVNLVEADLKGADLRGADLRFANLVYADLRGADLRGAYYNKDQKNYWKSLRIDYYDKHTKFPDNFDPESRGMIFISE